MTSTSHSAADSFIGYLYQSRWALVELLRGRRDSPDAAISLELHDDVAWETEGTPSQLLSLKHHRTAKSLTDTSDDLWRTFRVWRDSGTATDPNGPQLVLVTTSTAAANSAAMALRQDAMRDESAALARLTTAATTSVAEGTSDVRAWFTSLTDSEKQVFIHKIAVADGAAPIADLRSVVRMELWWALPRQGSETFLDLLDSWWDGVALDMLQRKRSAVSRLEAHDRVAELRDMFAPDNLPTLVELADVDDDLVVEAHENRLFVTQMQWVTYTLPNVRRAIIDYYRAVEQTTRWLADDLIGLAELRKFENNLRDEWARAFDDMLDDLGSDADEETKVAAGKDLLRRLLDSTSVTVRDRYNDRFFARGKRHELADDGRAGWHPDFRSRVEALLGEAS